jgi:Mg2+-importing ATPase
LFKEIPVDELVPGDIIKLSAGDLVPADVRLLRASGLTVHQAVLTGESAPVVKSAADIFHPDGIGMFEHRTASGCSSSRSCASRAAASPPAVPPRSSSRPERTRNSPPPTGVRPGSATQEL